MVSFLTDGAVDTILRAIAVATEGSLPVATAAVSVLDACLFTRAVLLNCQGRLHAAAALAIVALAQLSLGWPKAVDITGDPATKDAGARQDDAAQHVMKVEGSGRQRLALDSGSQISPCHKTQKGLESASPSKGVGLQGTAASVSAPIECAERGWNAGRRLHAAARPFGLQLIDSCYGSAC